MSLNAALNAILENPVYLAFAVLSALIAAGVMVAVAATAVDTFVTRVYRVVGSRPEPRARPTFSAAADISEGADRP